MMTSLRASTCSLLLLTCLIHTAYSLKVPPRINDPKQSLTRYEMTGAKIVLKCSAEGNPTPQYRWEFNKKAIASDFIKVDTTTGDLTIETFSRREQGNYQCLAQNLVSPNNVAVAMSPIIRIIKAGMEQAWPVSNLTVFRPEEGSYLKLTCDNQPLSIPAAVYSWFSVQGEGTESDGEIHAGPRIYIDAQGSLHFIYVELEDSSTNMFKCGMYNSFDSVIKLGSGKRITVKKNEPLPQVRSDIQFHTNPAEFLISQDAELECVFSGNPIPRISWFDDDLELLNDGKYTISDNGRKLTIKNIVEDDEKTYQCIGSNTLGRQNALIYLDVTSGPIWEESLSSQMLSAGRDATFTCKARPATGDPPLDPPKWYRNGKPLSRKTTEKFEFRDDYRVLTVKNLNKATDIMCLQCEVSNKIGTEFGDGCLNIVQPIKITSQPALEQTVYKGNMVNLTVIGTSDPEVKLYYRWQFNGKKYETDPPPFVTYDEETKVAYINTSALSEEEYRTINGTYYRELYHKQGENVTVAIRVYLADIPDAGPAVVAAGGDLWWIALVVALLILIIVVVLIVCICNRMRQEGTYPLDKKERANDLDPEKDLQDSGFHDLSRAAGDDEFPGKKSSGINPNFEPDDMDMGDDDESLMEYGGGDLDTTKFNEDGSFIGQYVSKSKTPEVKQNPMPTNHHTTESQI